MTAAGDTSHDVVIVGGGPAGLGAAIRLRQHGMSVAVVERAAGHRTRIGESVPAELRSLLQALGAWPAFCAQGHLASTGSSSAWATPDLERSDAFCSPLGGGWHLDRRRFEAMLAGEAVRAGADLRRATRVVGVESAAGEACRVHAVGPAERRRVLDAQVVIDATGRSATVARWLGARRWVHDRLICAHAVFARGERASAAGRTLVEAVEDGWWYATPLPGGRALAALFSDAPTFRARGYGTVPPWHTALRRAAHVFEYVGRPREPHALCVDAVTPHCLDPPAGRDWMAVGDAAASFDPLSSAGIVVALRDGLRAADAVRRHLDHDSGALAEHGLEAQRRFTRYLIQRAKFYDLGHRWPASPFWNERAPGRRNVTGMQHLAVLTSRSSAPTVRSQIQSEQTRSERCVPERRL